MAKRQRSSPELKKLNQDYSYWLTQYRLELWGIRETVKKLARLRNKIRELSQKPGSPDNL